MHFSIFLRLSSHPLKMGEFSRRIFIKAPGWLMDLTRGEPPLAACRSRIFRSLGRLEKTIKKPEVQ